MYDINDDALLQITPLIRCVRVLRRMGTPGSDNTVCLPKAGSISSIYLLEMIRINLRVHSFL